MFKAEVEVKFIDNKDSEMYWSFFTNSTNMVYTKKTEEISIEIKITEKDWTGFIKQFRDVPPYTTFHGYMEAKDTIAKQNYDNARYVAAMNRR